MAAESRMVGLITGHGTTEARTESSRCARNCCWTPLGHSTVRDHLPSWDVRACTCHMFDRWLAAHDHQVRATALREAADDFTSSYWPEQIRKVDVTDRLRGMARGENGSKADFPSEVVSS